MTFRNLISLDMVAVPDFNSGAMENWGIITYRESAMFYRKGVSSETNKQRIALIVAHELAHMVYVHHLQNCMSNRLGLRTDLDEQNKVDIIRGWC